MFFIAWNDVGITNEPFMICEDIAPALLPLNDDDSEWSIALIFT